MDNSKRQIKRLLIVLAVVELIVTVVGIIHVVNK